MIPSRPAADPLRRKVAAAHTWLVETALPLWRDTGFDAACGLFHERLDFNGRPLAALPRRLTVQARQIYVFAHAGVLGWSDARDRVATAFARMVEGYRAADGGGWVFSLHPDGTVADDRRDLYAHSFLLLACAWVFRLTGDARAIAVAEEVLGVIDRDFTAAAGGYRDTASGDDSALRQNPHMHLFEALLALFQATGAAHFLDRADHLHGLLRRFFVAGPDILVEHFDAAWRPLPTTAAGAVSALWEPGHHCEWAWLLQRHAEAHGRACDPIAARLYERAYRDGISATGMIADEMTGDGRVTKASRRAWPLTEAIKANADRHRAGDPRAAARADAALGVLMRDFLRPDGLWLDQRDAAGAAMVDYVPASTLYHVFLAIAEADVAFDASA